MGGVGGYYLLDILDDWGYGAQIVPSYFYPETLKEIFGDVAFLGKKLYLVFVEGRLPKIAVKSHPVNHRRQQIPSDKILFTDTNPVFNFALLYNNFPQLLRLVVVAEQHFQEHVGGLNDAVVELFEVDVGELLGEGGVEVVDLAAEDGGEDGGDQVGYEQFF